MKMNEVNAMQFHSDVLNQLIAHYRDDADALDMIVYAIETFEDYHRAIYKLETTRRLHSCQALDAETYRRQTTDGDRNRTSCHNAVLSQVNILNRLAEQANLPPVYDGTVSEQRPYRREVANAVLDFIQEVMLNRA